MTAFAKTVGWALLALAAFVFIGIPLVNEAAYSLIGRKIFHERTVVDNPGPGRGGFVGGQGGQNRYTGRACTRRDGSRGREGYQNGQLGCFRM